MRLARPSVLALLASAFLSCGSFAASGPFGYVFTYQGKLSQSGSPVNGTANMVFKLYDEAVAGNQVGQAVTLNNVPVSGGLFTVDLDFLNNGTIPGVFDGNERWVEATVNGIVLSPRQRLAPAPHAIMANMLTLPLAQDTASGAPFFIRSHANIGQVRVIHAETTSDQIGAIAVIGEATDQTANTENIGVLGTSYSGNGFGVMGVNYATGGNCTGILGSCASPAGAGVSGYNGVATGGTKGVYGKVESPTGWGGYFEGRGYFSGFLGVGVSGPLNASTMFQVRHPATTGYGGMYVDTAGAGAWPFYGYANNGISQAWTYYDGTADVWKLSVGSADRITVLATNGNVGIGTTSPTALLSVNGAANKPGGGSWAVFSDARLKKNVANLDGSLEKLLSLRGVTFEYRDPSAINETPGRHIGMIAQEVEPVFPQWVSQNSNGCKQLSFTGFEALTVEALRDLRNEKNSEIASLRQTNAELQGEVAQLLARVQALETAASNR